MLQNTQLSLDEFQDFYDSYSLSEDYTFHDELREAHRIKDLNQIKKVVALLEREIRKKFG